MIWAEWWMDKTFPAVCGEVAEGISGCTGHSSSVCRPRDNSEFIAIQHREARVFPWVQALSLEFFLGMEQVVPQQNWCVSLPSL
jgi:hypothetical protein